MTKIKKNWRDEYIVIHHVRGEESVLDFLRNTSHTIIDRLCFEAKNHGKAEFRFRNDMYIVTYERGDTFVIQPAEDSTTQIW
jgi:hypothetical protein